MINGNEPTACLTIRQEFAARAMQGYISAGSTGMPDPKDLARLAVITADFLIAELSKTKS